MSAPGTISVLLDTYGASAGPEELLEAAGALSLQGGPHVVLLGELSAMRASLSRTGYDPMRVRLVDAGVPYPHLTGDRLAADRAAHEALPRAMELLAAGEVDAMVSSSSPVVVRELATAGVARIADDLPVAEAAVFPTMPRRGSDDPLALLVDVSGRGHAGADELCAYARMGAAYSRVVSGIREPRVALLSTDVEVGSGPESVRQAYARLRPAGGFAFVGNVRAADLPRGLADVVVVDGFTGHAVRGLLESVAEITVDAARYAWRKKRTWRVAMRLLSEGVGLLRRVSEFKEYGGAPILGLRRPVIVTDAGAGSRAVGNAIKLAAKCARRGLADEIERVRGLGSEAS